MADEDVQAVLAKAVNDPAFRLALSRDFDGAITAHQLNLSADEANALRQVNWSGPITDFQAGPAVASRMGAGPMARWVHIYN